MSAHPPMYVRIKRKKQTVFLHCDLNDTIATLKARVALIMGTQVPMQKLLLGRQNLEDHNTLADCGIEKDSPDTVLFLIQRLDDGQSGEEVWEEVEIAPTGPGSSPPAGALPGTK